MIQYEKDPLDCRYASHEDIKVKLNGSWVYYDGVPVKVTTNVDDNYKNVSIVSLEKGRWSRQRTVSCTDTKFDQYNLRYGWFNSSAHGRAVLSSRIPSRRYKQGIHNEVLSMVAGYGAGLTPVTFDVLSIDEMMRGIYPSLDEAMVKLREYNSVALSRDVAILKHEEEYRVYVGELDCGKFHFDSRTVEVTKDGVFSIIQAFLQEVGL